MTQEQYEKGDFNVFELLQKAQEFKLVDKNETDSDGFDKEESCKFLQESLMNAVLEEMGYLNQGEHSEESLFELLLTSRYTAGSLTRLFIPGGPSFIPYPPSFSIFPTLRDTNP